MISRLKKDSFTDDVYFFVYDQKDNEVCVGFGKTIREVAKLLGCTMQDVKNMVYYGCRYKNRYTCEKVECAIDDDCV